MKVLQVAVTLGQLAILLTTAFPNQFMAMYTL